MIRIAVLGTALALLGAAETVQAARHLKEPTPAQRGHLVAVRRCAACHAIEPGGVSPRARAPGFATVEMQHTAGLEGRLQDLTQHGHYDMPPVPLQPGEVADLLAYIQSTESRDR